MKRCAIKRKTPLRRVSRKQSLALRKYYRLRKPFLASHPRCEACVPLGYKEPRPSTEVHHMKYRGKYLNDQTTWLATCHSCGQEIHRNPKRSRELGLLA